MPSCEADQFVPSASVGIPSITIYQPARWDSSTTQVYHHVLDDVVNVFLSKEHCLPAANVPCAGDIVYFALEKADHFVNASVNIIAVDAPYQSYISAAGPFVPVKHLTSALPRLTYQIYFDTETDAAVAELNADIKRTLRATFRTVDSPPPESMLTSNGSFLGAWDGIEIPPVPFFNLEEENYYVDEVKTQGFGNTLQFYSAENRYQSWELAHASGNHTIPQPVLAVYPRQDPVADWVVASNILKSSSFLPKLTTELLDGAHWVHLENSKIFNNVVRTWLNEQFGGVKHVRDTWAEQICKYGWGGWVRCRIYGRQELGRTPTEEEIGQISGGDAWKTVTPEDIARAFTRGEETLGVWTMKCVAYQEDFQRDIAEKFLIWVPPTRRKGKKGTKPASKKNPVTQAKAGRKRKRSLSESDEGEEDMEDDEIAGEKQEEPEKKSDKEEPAYRTKGTRSRPIVLC